jgi:putative DNA methylase
MRDEAERRVGHLYPKVEIRAEMAKDRPDLKAYVGSKLTVIAWLRAGTVKSPNPAFATVGVPFASTFMLSTKAGKEARVQPVIEGSGYRFTVKMGKPESAAASLVAQLSSGSELARALLPPLHRLRAQEASSRCPFLQRTGAELARDHAPRA